MNDLGTILEVIAYHDYIPDTEGMKILYNNYDKIEKILYNSQYNGFVDPDLFYENLTKEIPDLRRHLDIGQLENITPSQRRILNGGKALTGFNAQPAAPMRDPSRLTKFEKPAGALGKPANSIMKGGMRGAAHLIPVVGAGLTAADIYQGLNQPVAAGTLDWNQMTPQQQAARVQGYQQVQDIIDNIQARQRVEDQYRQKQADMIRRARFGI